MTKNDSWVEKVLLNEPLTESEFKVAERWLDEKGIRYEAPWSYLPGPSAGKSIG
jgi:hypothetical protein